MTTNIYKNKNKYQLFVMSPGPVLLPLTARGHHLPSSWTNLPKRICTHTLRSNMSIRTLYK